MGLVQFIGLNAAPLAPSTSRPAPTGCNYPKYVPESTTLDYFITSSVNNSGSVFKCVQKMNVFTYGEEFKAV